MTSVKITDSTCYIMPLVSQSSVAAALLWKAGVLVLTKGESNYSHLPAEGNTEGGGGRRATAEGGGGLWNRRGQERTARPR
eukprot:COSAG02_NODE_60405_length_271_cov_0.895349_1_plen_81_part_00